MDIEELLRKRLRTDGSRPMPSPGFPERVHRALEPRPRRLPIRFAPAALTLVAVLALAVAALPWMLGDTRGGADVSASSAASSAAESTSTAPVLAEGRIWTFAFDYPADWTVRDRGTRTNFRQPANSSLGGIGAVRDDCSGVDTVDNRPCAFELNLADGPVGIIFEWNGWTGEPQYYEPWNLLRAVVGPAPAGTEPVTVAGVRAIFAKSDSARVPISPTTVDQLATITDADEVLSWELVDRFDGFDGFKITAALRGPDVPELEVQVMALVASLHYATPIAPLPTDDATKAGVLRKVLDDNAQRIGCFSRTPGASATATVTSADLTQLSKPLAVRCTTKVDIAPEQVWLITFTWEWDAAPDHPAGKAYEIWIEGPALDGAAIDAEGFETMPYYVTPSGEA